MSMMRRGLQEGQEEEGVGLGRLRLEAGSSRPGSSGRLLETTGAKRNTRPGRGIGLLTLVPGATTSTAAPPPPHQPHSPPSTCAQRPTQAQAAACLLHPGSQAMQQTDLHPVGWALLTQLGIRRSTLHWVQAAAAPTPARATPTR